MEKGDLIYCYNCGEKGTLKKLAKVDNSVRENLGIDEMPVMMDFNDILDILKCKNCNNISIYRSEWHDGEERNYADYSESTYVELFGKLIYPNIEHENRFYIPEKIYKSFLSSIKVKNIDRSFCLIGLRRTLEMICKEKGYSEGMLGKKLQKMSSDGIIPPVIDKIAKGLKDEGNKAAHGDDLEFSLNTVNNMIEFTRIILNYLYVLPKRIVLAQEEIEQI